MAAMKRPKRPRGKTHRTGEGLSLWVFSSRADRCDVQTKSGIRRMREGERREMKMAVARMMGVISLD